MSDTKETMQGGRRRVRSASKKVKKTGTKKTGARKTGARKTKRTTKK
jgi:hypothetical protein